MNDFNIRIFCEGISDQRFLRDFLKVHYHLDFSDKELEQNNFINKLNSFNKLKDRKSLVTETFSEYTSLIFLDADDNKVIDKAGFEGTNKFVNDLMTSWNWTKYAIFVLPNNQDSGTVEDLLENVINKKHSQIFECWNEFEKCISKDKSLKIPAKKSKIYSYLECLNEKDNCSDRNRNFQDENLWEIRNLENPYILKLKQFLDQYLK